VQNVINHHCVLDPFPVITAFCSFKILVIESVTQQKSEFSQHALIFLFSLQKKLTERVDFRSGLTCFHFEVNSSH